MRILSAKIKEEDTTVLIVSVGWDDGEEEEELREYAIQEGEPRSVLVEGIEQVLIESQEQIEKRLASQNYDFSYCIFLCDANFSGKKFSEKAYFEKAIFCGVVSFEAAEFKGAPCFRRAVFSGNANFGVCTFCRLADFWGATFSQYANFKLATFSKDADFRISEFNGNASFELAIFGASACFQEAIFSQQVSFQGAEFSQQVNFRRAMFKRQVNFSVTTFSRKTDFRQATFSGEADFLKSEISGSIDFFYAKFDSVFNFQDVKAGKGFSLSLLGVEIENLWYMGSDIPRAENRETFLILKQHASKQLDNVGALEFYKKEMKQYKEDLQKDEKKASCADRIILWFEWGASRYGTAPFRATLWLLVLHGLYVFAIIYFFCNPEDISWAVPISNHLSDPLSIPFDLSKNSTLDQNIWLAGINLAKNILSAVLAYEIIKSFRKYSRRL